MELFEFDDLYLRRLKEHDRQTEEHFFSYFRALLFSKLRHRLSSVQAIEDVIQETLTRVYARLDELRDSHKLGGFVNGVCKLVLLEWYRNGSRTEPLGETHDDIAGAEDLEKKFFVDESDARVRRVLARVEPRDAELLKAVFLDEEEKDELCRRLGVSRDYLRVLVHRAKEKFKAEFRKKSGPHSILVTFSTDSSLSL